MSEERREAPEHEPPHAETVIPEAPPPIDAAPHRAAAGWGPVALILAAVAILVAVVGTAPFWAGRLPWGAGQRDDRALTERLDRLAETQQQEAATQRQAEQQLRKAAGDTTAALQQLGQRIAALEARPALPADEIGGIKRALAALSNTTAAMTTRVEAIDKAVQAQATRDDSGTPVALLLLQIRSAVAVGRPFPAEYEALAKLVHGNPELTQAALPLAGPAKTGVASRSVLADGLRRLEQEIAEPRRQPEPQGWSGALWKRLSGLVTIRRLNGGNGGSNAAGTPEAAVSAAERDLAGGDLAGAAAALDKLTGAPAEAARPWLQMARQRIAVEAALQRLEALLAARLAPAAAAPRSAG